MISSYGDFRHAVEGWAAVWRRVRPAALIVAVLGGALMAAASLAPAMAAGPLRVAMLGDSLTAGYGLPADAAFPVKLKKALEDKGIEIEAVNAGVSGDTASDGRDRLDWSIPEGTEAVIVELGANDALRGLDPAVTRAALEDIVKRLRGRGIAVMLCGMYAPRNLGPDYVAKFDPIYPELARAYDLTLYPFFLDGVAGDAKLTQADGLHPNAAGVDVIVARIAPMVEAFVRRVAAARKAAQD
ncbi:MAG: arylesterase [Xanthobacteraceae bacterium]|nr:arylesterase [Xanthobacteraceae bacterium]